MKKYKIRYYYDGEGEAIIEADNQQEAEEKWENGDWLSDDDWGENYVIEIIEKLES